MKEHLHFLDTKRKEVLEKLRSSLGGIVARFLTQEKTAVLEQKPSPEEAIAEKLGLGLELRTYNQEKTPNEKRYERAKKFVESIINWNTGLVSLRSRGHAQYGLTEETTLTTGGKITDIQVGEDIYQSLIFRKLNADFEHTPEYVQSLLTNGSMVYSIEQSLDSIPELSPAREELKSKRVTIIQHDFASESTDENGQPVLVQITYIVPSERVVEQSIDKDPWLIEEMSKFLIEEAVAELDSVSFVRFDFDDELVGEGLMLPDLSVSSTVREMRSYYGKEVGQVYVSDSEYLADRAARMAGIQANETEFTSKQGNRDMFKQSERQKTAYALERWGGSPLTEKEYQEDAEELLGILLNRGAIVGIGKEQVQFTPVGDTRVVFTAGRIHEEKFGESSRRLFDNNIIHNFLDLSEERIRKASERDEDDSEIVTYIQSISDARKDIDFPGFFDEMAKEGEEVMFIFHRYFSGSKDRGDKLPIEMVYVFPVDIGLRVEKAMEQDPWLIEALSELVNDRANQELTSRQSKAFTFSQSFLERTGATIFAPAVGAMVASLRSFRNTRE